MTNADSEQPVNRYVLYIPPSPQLGKACAHQLHMFAHP